MPLQNRVTPFGDVVALPGRGMLMGNRGILHDDARRIVRPWAVRRWIACATEFRGRHRAVMTPHQYTELFFLDEAAAFAAGHRPCAECRNADYKCFSQVWKALFGGMAVAETIDARLDAERRDGRAKRTFRSAIRVLPNGTYVALDGAAWLIWKRGLHAWSDSGYTVRRALPESVDVDVLTPRSIVDLFNVGYEPVVHPSVTAGDA
jgi:hypothetical protein